MKKVFRNIFIGIGALFVALVVISLVERYITEDIFYRVFIAVGAMGAFNSGLLAASIHLFINTRTVRFFVLNKLALWFSIISNVLFYMNFYLLFAFNNDWIAVYLLLQIVIATVNASLLIIAYVKAN